VELLSDEADVRRGIRIAGGTAVGLLVKGAFDVLETMTSGRYLSADELRRGVETLGRPLIETPEQDWASVSVSSLPRLGDTAFGFVVPLWTVDGRSALGMAAQTIPTAYGTFDIEVTGFVPLDATAFPAGVNQQSPEMHTTVLRGGHESRTPVPDRWRPVLASIVHRLVLGDYAGMAADGLISYSNDPTDASIGRWIKEYPAHLVDLPADAWAYSEHGPDINVPGSWWVIVDLWTAEEGHSDLSMEATVWDDGVDVVVKVRNVHVM
jgi:hypothetical protein